MRKSAKSNTVHPHCDIFTFNSRIRRHNGFYPFSKLQHRYCSAALFSTFSGISKNVLSYLFLQNYTIRYDQIFIFQLFFDSYLVHFFISRPLSSYTLMSKVCSSYKLQTNLLITRLKVQN